MSFPTIRLLEGSRKLSLSFQLKNNLKHAISSGHLRPKTQMPSVRDLADQLGIAANTVARAYKELQDDGLLVTYAGKGTFVADIITHSELAGDDRETLVAILRPAVDTARSVGFTQAQVEQTVSELFIEPSLHVALVGINQVVVAKWQKILEQEFASQGMRVTALTLAELQEDYERAIEAVSSCYYVLSLVTTYAETRAFFRDLNKKVVAIITEVSMVTHQLLSDLPHDRKTGLVCEDIYANNLMSVISPYIDLNCVVRVGPDDTDALEGLLATTPAVLHTISMKETVHALASDGVQLIEMEFLPNRSCFDQMRQMFIRVMQPA